MNGRRRAQLRPWMLFAYPAATVIPITAAILLAGPAIGLLVALVAVLAIVVAAVRMPPRTQAATPVPQASGAPEDGGWRAFVAARAVAVLLIATPGIVLAAATAGTTAIVGWSLVAVAGTFAISFVFLGIGYSEDRAREREQGPRSRDARQATSAPGDAPARFRDKRR
jgi:uncharacterized membrane protein